MSSHFLTSEFVGNFELPLIEKRAGQGRLKLFILILDHIPKTPLLKSIQYVNSSAKPYHHISEAEQELILTELHDAICDQLRRDQTGIEHHIDVLTFKSSVVAMAILRVLDSSEKSYSITELTKMIQSASSTVSRKGVSDAIKALEKAALIERRDMKQNKSTNAQVHFASSKNSQKFLNILNPSDQ
jgi:DNA-binding HxlR family transcriptional regulator